MITGLEANRSECWAAWATATDKGWAWYYTHEYPKAQEAFRQALGG